MFDITIKLKNIKSDDLIIKPGKILAQVKIFYTEDEYFSEPVCDYRGIITNGYYVAFKGLHNKILRANYLYEKEIDYMSLSPEERIHADCSQEHYWEFKSQEEASKFIRNFDVYKKHHPHGWMMFNSKCDELLPSHWQACLHY